MLHRCGSYRLPTIHMELLSRNRQHCHVNFISCSADVDTDDTTMKFLNA